MAVVLGLFVMMKIGSDGTMTAEAPDAFGHAERVPVERTATRDLHSAGLDLSRPRGGDTYEAYDSRRDAIGSDAFHGFGCTRTCEGHAAGYRWAEQEGIATGSECDGNSWAFIEGCVAYAEQYGEPPSTDPRKEIGLF